MSVNSKMTAIADAIRDKTGGTASLSLDDMATQIANISTGVELNFEVVCNPQPSTAKENTIWVDTDKINNYYFSATQPENMVDYDVWFSTGRSSTGEFNALKKNGIHVYPISAKQYVSGVWVDVTAKSYQNSEWVEWISYLYNKGNTYDHITGGWDSSLTISQFNAHNMNRKNAEFGEKSIIFDLTNASNFTYIPISSGLIDFTDIKTIYIDYTVKSIVYGAFFGISTSNTIASVSDPSIPAKVKFIWDETKLGNNTVALDVSSISSGSYYVVVWSYVGEGFDPRGCFEINSIRKEQQP